MKKTTTLTLSNLLSQSISSTGNKKNTFQLKKMLLTVIGVIAMCFGSVFAQNIFNVASGNWNTAANWSLGHVPNGTENLVIPSGDVCTMDVSYSGGNTFTLTIAGTLNVPSGITLNQTKDTVIMSTNGATLSGGGSVDLYIFNIATTNATDVVNITNSSAAAPISIGLGNTSGTINFTKGLLKLTGQTLAVAKTATINGNGFNGNVGNFAHKGDGAGDAYADGGTLALIGNSGATTTVNGSVTFYNVNGSGGNVVLDLKTATSIINGTATLVSQQGKLGNTNSPIWGDSSTLYIDYSSAFDYTPSKEWVPVTGSQTDSTPGYPNNVTLTNIGTSAGGRGNGNGWAPGSGDYSIKGVLTLGDAINNNAQVDFSNLSNFSCSGFVLNNGSRFSAPTTMTVNGNWTDNQAFAGSISNPTTGFINFNSSGVYYGTVIFGGKGTCSAANTITAPAGKSETFDNLTIDTAYIALNSPVVLVATGVLTLTSGIIKTTAANILTVNNNSTSAIIGGSATNYIDGPVKWAIAASSGAYIFPVGAGGCTTTYLPFTLNVTTSTANTATVQAFNVGSNGTTDGSLSSLSPTEYWVLSTGSAITGGYGVSVTRPTPVAPYVYIADSIGNVANHFTSLVGTASGNSVVGSNPIGAGSTFYIALGAPPIVSTLPATSITTTSATLNGAFNTNNTSLPTSFNYGLTTNYGTSVMTLHSPLTTSSSISDSVNITGLTANTLYNFIATDGANNGSNVTFITAPNPPTVGVGSNITSSSFTGNWTAPAVPGTATYTYTVQISTDPTFATGVTTQTGIASSTTSYSFTGLASATAYYYRVQAVNATASSVWSATSNSVTTNIFPTQPCTTGTGSTTSTGSIIKAPILPVIDGQVDTVWNGVPANNISFLTTGGNTGNTQTWKAMWSTDTLYFLVQVNDPTLISQAAGLVGTTSVAGATQSTCGSQPYYGSDGVEIALAPDGVLGNGYNGYNDVQFRFNLGSTIVSGQSSGGANQFTGAIFNSVYQKIDFKIVTTANGYTVEAAIPLSPGIDSLQGGGYFAPANGQNIGLEVQVNDATSASGCRAAQYSWFNGSTDPYENPSTFAEATYTSCPIPPTVVLPTVTNITATSALLGATVTSSGDAVLTANGTGYTVSPLNSATSNALAASTVVTPSAAYTMPRTSLAPQTKYYFLGYANNANNETGVSTVSSFYTLSALPAAQPTLSAATCSGVTLNWTAATFPATDSATQTGYLILRRQDGTNPTATGISTRIATTQATLPAGTTLVTTISSGAALSYIDASAVSGTTYNYLLVPFTWDGTATDSTYNYDTLAASTTTATVGVLKTPIFTITPSTICLGGEVPVLPMTSNNSITGTWNPATISNTATGNSSYVFTPAVGQCAKDTTITITVNAGSITPLFTIAQTICTGSDAPELPTASSNSITGAWEPATVSNTAIGNSNYIFTPNAGQCAKDTTVTVTVTQIPSITVSPSTTITSGTQIALVGTSTVPGASYTWASNPIGFNSTDSATVASPTQTTIYNLTVVSGTCPPQTGSDTVTVNLSPCQVRPLKFFSPNGDGQNDIWKISTGSCDITAVVSVYNRWGGLVFHTDTYQLNTSNGFTGNYKGNPLPDGTYYYVIQVVESGNSYPSTLTGNVTIVR